MFNPAISVLRVFSMMLIFFTHFLTWKGINCFQIATVGVSVFLFISGFLYGSRDIGNKKTWMVGRVKKVLVPFWILSFFLVIYLFVKGNSLLALETFFESLFNLQGFHNLLKIPVPIGNMHVSGISHCWFLTVIMLCYAMVCFIKHSKLESIIDLNVKKSLLLVVVAQFCLCFVSIVIGHIVIFFIGYFLARKFRMSFLMNRIVFVFLSILTILVFALRVYLRTKIDGSVVYDGFVASFSTNMCALWCFIFVTKACACCKKCSSLVVSSKIWKLFDGFTYPVYLTHYMFLTSPFNLNSVGLSSTLREFLLFIFVTVISAFVLQIILKLITHFCGKCA